MSLQNFFADFTLHILQTWIGSSGPVTQFLLSLS